MKTYRISALLMVGILVLGVPVRAQTVPELINYQGKLMDGTNLFSGPAVCVTP